MLRALACVLALCLPLLAWGCGSSSDTTHNGTVSLVTITLTDASNVDRVFVFHQAPDGLWDIVSDTSYSTPQSTIQIPLSVVDGDAYRVEADIPNSDGTTSFSFQDFVANNGSVTLVEPGIRSQAAPTGPASGQVPNTLTISVPKMHPLR